MFNVFQAASDCLGSYDEFPTMPKGTDPMPCLSRNLVPQPFHLVGAKDEVLISMAGTATVQLPGASPASTTLRAGEALYLPAGQPSRIVPDADTIQLRYKPEPPDWEAATWYCGGCSTEVHRREFRASECLPQECYWTACDEFNRDERLRTCRHCGAVLAPCDLTGIRWLEVAERIREADDADAASRRVRSR